MVTHPTRRRLLQLSGVGVTASLAGCSQLNVLDDSEDSEPELDADAEPDIDPADGITAIVQPSQEDLSELEQEVMEDLQAGEIDQQEMQAEFQQGQAQLTAARAVEVESELTEDDELSIEAGIAEQGAFLLDGTDERLVDTLRNDEVSGLIPGEEYGTLLEQIQQQEQAQETPDPEGEDAPESDPEDADGDAEAADNETDDGANDSDDADDTNETDADDAESESDADNETEDYSNS